MQASTGIRTINEASRQPARETTPSAHYIGIGERSDKRSSGNILRLFLSLTLAVALLPSGAYAASGDRVGGVSPKELGVPSAAMPDVGMKAGMLVTEDGRVLWSRRASDRRAMASITKIMTAVVALENSREDEPVTISVKARSTGDASGLLSVGQKLPMSELLEALLVKSSNDAAVAIAEHISGTETQFVAKMNAKAKELGLSRTQFRNAHGLDETGHFSTAADLAVLARYAMRDSRFRRYVGEETARVGTSGKLDSTNLLLGNYDGANGVKTGWTDDAGYSVIGSARRGSIELYAVVLGTPGEAARFAQARELLDWGFAHYREQHLVSAGTVVGEAVVTDYLDQTVPAAVATDTELAVFDLAGTITRDVSVVSVRAPVKVGDRVGVVRFTQGNKVVATAPLLATERIEKPNWFERVGIAITRTWRRFVGGPLVAQPAPAAAVSY